MEMTKDELVVVPLKQLTEIIQTTVNETMEKWLEAKVRQEREDKANEESTITMNQLMEQFHISRTSVYSRIREGVLKPIRFGNKLQFIKKDVIEAYKSGKMEKYVRRKV